MEGFEASAGGTPERIGLNRRELVKLSAFAGLGLAIGCASQRASATPEPAERAGSAKVTSNDSNVCVSHYIQINENNSVKLILPWTEAGQGIATGVATLVGEELDLDPASITFASAGYNDLIREKEFDSRETGGGAGIGQSWEFVRASAIAARMLLLEAAAKEWKVPVAECALQDGKIIHSKSARRVPMGAFATQAAKLDLPAKSKIEAALAKPRPFKYVGKSVHRIDLLDKVTGTACFGTDVKVDGMLAATILHSPFVGGVAGRIDDSEARAAPGVVQIVPTAYGVAVVADTIHNAFNAARKLEVEWTGINTALSSESIAAEQRKLLERPGKAAQDKGDAPGALKRGHKASVFEYELPYLPHATLEPQNCTAWVKADGEVEVWAPTQSPGNAQRVAASVAKVPVEKVRVHVTLAGGAFGRRLRNDYVAEAVLVSAAVGKPVKLIWSREEDFIRDYYRPASSHRVEASLTSKGKITGWRHRIACSSITAWDNDKPPSTPGPLEGIDEWAVEGAINQPYGIPNLRTEYHQHESGVPVTWLRGVGHSHNAFVVETVLDEIARGAGADPLRYRLDLLRPEDDYFKALQLVAAKGGWNGGRKGSLFQGIAVHESLGSTVAQLVEIELVKGAVQVKRVVCAVASGLIVNPDIVRQSMESSIVQGLGSALHQEITLRGGQYEQRSFFECKLLSMAETPKIEVHFVPGGTLPRSIDSGVPSVAPALCNAIALATGKRVRKLPIDLS